MCRNKSCSFSKRMFRAQWMPIRRQPPVRGRSPQNFAFRTMQMPPTLKTKSGEVRIVDTSNFKVSTTAMALVTVHPGGLRELHWHPNADEWRVLH